MNRVIRTVLLSSMVVSALHATPRGRVTVTWFPPAVHIAEATSGDDASAVESKKKDSTCRRIGRSLLAAGIGAGAGAILAAYEKKHGFSLLRIILLVSIANPAVAALCTNKEVPIADLAGILSYMASYAS